MGPWLTPAGAQSLRPSVLPTTRLGSDYPGDPFSLLLASCFRLDEQNHCGGGGQGGETWGELQGPDAPFLALGRFLSPPTPALALGRRGWPGEAEFGVRLRPGRRGTGSGPVGTRIRRWCWSQGASRPWPFKELQTPAAPPSRCLSLTWMGVGGKETERGGGPPECCGHPEKGISPPPLPKGKAGGLLLCSTGKDHLLCTHRIRIPGSCGVQRGQGQGPHAKSWYSVG